jgi:hypothetical protein
MYIFIDESGDLGFDFSKPGPSKYFTITLLVCESEESYKAIKHAVLKTLKRKINYGKKKGLAQELKGSHTAIEVKRYFLNQMPDSGWSLYSVTINKQKAPLSLQSKSGKNKLYNFITRKLLETLNPPQTLEYISIIIDSSKDSAERKYFNSYIKSYLKSAFNLKTEIYISHENSLNAPGLQAVDMFCWGIQQKETTGSDEWIKLYESKVVKNIKFDKREVVPTPRNSHSS